MPERGALSVLLNVNWETGGDGVGGVGGGWKGGGVGRARRQTLPITLCVRDSFCSDLRCYVSVSTKGTF